MNRMVMAAAIIGSLGMNAPVNAEGFYINGGLQRTVFKLPDDNNWYQNQFTYDTNLKKIGASAGLGIHLSKYLDFEVNHRYLGTGEIRHAFNLEDSAYWSCKSSGACPMATGADRTKWQVRGESFDLLPLFPINKNITIYGRIGYFHYRVNSYTEAWQLGHESEPCWKETIHGKGSSLFGGIGGFYKFNKKNAIGLEGINFPNLEVVNTASKSAYQFGLVYRHDL